MGVLVVETLVSSSFAVLIFVQTIGANCECNGRVWRMDVGMSKGVLNARPQVGSSGFPAQCQAWSIFPRLHLGAAICPRLSEVAAISSATISLFLPEGGRSCCSSVLLQPHCSRGSGRKHTGATDALRLKHIPYRTAVFDMCATLLQVLEIEPVDARGNTKVRILSPPLQALLPPPPPPVEALRSHYPI